MIYLLEGFFGSTHATSSTMPPIVATSHPNRQEGDWSESLFSGKPCDDVYPETLLNIL